MKKIKKIIISAAAAALTTTTAMADAAATPIPTPPVADPAQMINNLNSWLLGLFSALGVTVCIFGFFQLISTWGSHDMTQRINAILIIAGGLALIGIGAVLYSITGVKV